MASMDGLLLLKVTLTPLLIAGVSLAGRRWGPAVSGLLVALPLTSGPVALFLALAHGVPFAESAALGTLAGVIPTALFCVVYAWGARVAPWWEALLGGYVVFFGGVWALRSLQLPPAPLFLLVVVALGASLALLPRPQGKAEEVAAPWWDIPARMVVATGFVLLLTSAAGALGPRVSGMLATFPLFVSVLIVFTARLHGAGATLRMLRGVVAGLFAFAVFFLTLTSLLPVGGVALAFALATGAALAVQAGSLAWSQRRAQIWRAV